MKIIGAGNDLSRKLPVLSAALANFMCAIDGFCYCGAIALLAQYPRTVLRKTAVGAALCSMYLAGEVVA